jgi:tRNA1Val (adenine37-N6)-methyltransferase
MKVGTDSVLLGAWVEAQPYRQVLDIGTGTGILAIMMAQKCNAQIDAIELDVAACEQARENAANCFWADRIHVYNTTLQKFSNRAHTVYDLIIANPPYFVDSHKASGPARNMARHMDETLSFNDLLDGVRSLLSDDGRFCVILPYKEGLLFYKEAVKFSLYCSRITRVKTKIEKTEKRLMMAFSKNMLPISEDEIVILDNNNLFTQQYIDLTHDFYLTPNQR